MNCCPSPEVPYAGLELNAGAPVPANNSHVAVPSNNVGSLVISNVTVPWHVYPFPSGSQSPLSVEATVTPVQVLLFPPLITVTDPPNEQFSPLQFVALII